MDAIWRALVISALAAAGSYLGVEITRRAVDAYGPDAEIWLRRRVDEQRRRRRLEATVRAELPHVLWEAYDATDRAARDDEGER